jgi:TRAP-type C4-dicarboxylate transport system permease small subunit
MFIERIGRWLDWVENLMAMLAIALLVAVTLSVCFEVVMRYGFNAPQIWVIELSEYALLYITFLGAAWVLHQGGHVRVDIFYNMASPRLRRVFGTISTSLGLVIAMLLCGFGANATWSAYARGMYKATLLEFPTWIVLLAIPVGSLMLTVRFLRQLIGHLGGKDGAGEAIEQDFGI